VSWFPAWFFITTFLISVQHNFWNICAWISYLRKQRTAQCVESRTHHAAYNDYSSESCPDSKSNSFPYCIDVIIVHVLCTACLINIFANIGRLNKFTRILVHAHRRREQVGLAIGLYSFLWEVFRTNLGLDSSFPAQCFSRFHAVFPGKCRDWATTLTNS
jgi:hypothetical protein